MSCSGGLRLSFSARQEKRREEKREEERREEKVQIVYFVL
jgi:hypothetical protein